MDYFIGEEMQKVSELTSELKMIMQDNDISQNFIITALDGKCSRNTILTFFKSGEDCRLSTLLMILDACGVELRLETGKSKAAILAGDIAAYRTEAEGLRSELEEEKREHDETRKTKDFLQKRYEELIDKNTVLTSTNQKMQMQLEKYMDRMENAENAVYKAMEDIRRKDARIVELSKENRKW